MLFLCADTTIVSSQSALQDKNAGDARHYARRQMKKVRQKAWKVVGDFRPSSALAAPLFGRELHDLLCEIMPNAAVRNMQTHEFH